MTLGADAPIAASRPPSADALGRRIAEMVHHTAVYGLGPLLRQVTGFLLLPLYTNLLSPSDYGTLELIVLVATVLNVFLGLQVATQIMRLYQAAPDDRQRHEAISTGIIFTALLTTAAIVPADATRGWISAALFGTETSAPLLRLALWSVVASNVLTGSLAYLQARRMSRAFTVLSIVHFLATVLLNLLLVAWLRWGVEGILLSQLVVSGTLAIGVAAWVLARTGIVVSTANVRQMVAFGLPLIGWSLAVFSMNAADRVVLSAVGSLSDVGVYSLASRFAAVLLVFVVAPFATFWSAERFAVAKQPSGQIIIGRIFTYFVTVLCFLGLGIGVWIGEVIRLMAAEEFWPAASVGPILVLAAILWAMFDFLMTGVLIAGRTRSVGIFTGIAAVFHVALCASLGATFLVAGIAWAKVVTLAALAVGVYMVAQRRYLVAYELGRLAQVLGVTFVLFCASKFLDGFPPLVGIAVKAPLLLAFPIALVRLGFLDDAERRWIGQAVKPPALQAVKTMGGFGLVKNSRWRRERLLILAYHGISIEDEHEWNPELYLPPEALRARFRMIREGGYTVLPLGEAVRRLLAGELPAKAVALTFDDGTHDFFERALPIIQEFNFPATVYVTTYYSEHNLPVFPVACSYILWKGRRLPLDCRDLVNEDLKLDLSDENRRTHARATILDFANRNELSAEAKNDLLARLARQLRVDFERLLAKRILRIMTPTEVAQAAAAGIDVQLHTHRHRTPKDRALFLREIKDNRRAIEQCTERVATHFCYPSGVHQPEFLPWLREADVTTATTSDPALATRKSDVLLLPRLVDTSLLSPIEFESWLAGVSQVLPHRSRAR